MQHNGTSVGVGDAWNHWTVTNCHLLELGSCLESWEGRWGGRGEVDPGQRRTIAGTWTVDVVVGGVVLDGENLGMTDNNLMSTSIGGEDAFQCSPTVRKMKFSKKQAKTKIYLPCWREESCAWSSLHYSNVWQQFVEAQMRCLMVEVASCNEKGLESICHL